MATKFLALTSAMIEEAELPIRVYFESGEKYVLCDPRAYLKLQVETRRPGFNGLPVYVLSYQQCDGEALDGIYLDFDAVGEEFFMSEEHARAALLERSKQADPKLRSAPSARSQLAELVLQSFEKTLGEAGASLGSILAAQLGEQLSLNVNERRDGLFRLFVGEMSMHYDDVSAYEAFFGSANEEIILPTWKWLEINVAFAALRFLSHKFIRGDDPSWEDNWDCTGLGSSEFIAASNDLLSQNPSAGAADWRVSIRAGLVQIAFLHMAHMSLDVQKALANRQAA